MKKEEMKPLKTNTKHFHWLKTKLKQTKIELKPD